MPEVHGSKKGLDPNLRPEWLVRKSQKPTENSRIEKREIESPGQRNQIIDQVNSEQRDEIRKSQLEQSRENIPEQNACSTRTNNSNVSKSNIHPHTKITRKSVTK